MKLPAFKLALMKAPFLVISIPWLLVSQLISQNLPEIRAQIMVLGSYHMHNPGADVFNVKADDVLTAKRQVELIQVVKRLADFNPTMIALEVFRGSERDSSTQMDYAQFLEGKFRLSRWEGHQIGFRLASVLGHPMIYNIDEPGFFPFQEMRDYAKEHNQEKWLNQQMELMQNKMDEERKQMQAKSILEQLVSLNQPEEIRKGHGIYVAGCQIGAGNSFPGTDVLTEWYKRNARIFTNLYRITGGKRDQERILVIFGVGHAHILRELIKDAPEFQLIEPNHFLDTRID